MAKDFVGGKERQWRVGEIVERLGRFKYKIKLNNGIQITRHADALKLMRGDTPDEGDTKENDPFPVIPKVQSGTGTEQLLPASDNSDADRQQLPLPRPSPPRTGRRNPPRQCGRPLRYRD